MPKPNNTIFEDNANKVLKDFAKRLKITPMQIIEKDKNRTISDMRQLYCKLRHEMHGVTLIELAQEIDRDPTTVRYSIMRINDLLMMKDRRMVALWKKVKNIPGYFV